MWLTVPFPVLSPGFLLARPGFMFVGVGKHSPGARIRGVRRANLRGHQKLRNQNKYFNAV